MKLPKFIIPITVVTLIILSITLIALISPKAMREGYASPPPDSFQSNDQMININAVTFYRTSNVAYAFTYAGNYTFNEDVYLIGFNAVTCKSESQQYEVLVLSTNIEDWYEIMVPLGDKYNPTGHTLKVYFYASLSSDGQDQATIILPSNMGFYIPKDETIHFQIFAPRIGTGGSFTVYYIAEAEL